MSKRFVLLAASLLVAFFSYAQGNSKGLIAVFITSDNGVLPRYEQILQQTMEEELHACGYSTIEHDSAYLQAVKDYNEYLRNSAVNPYAFTKMKTEKLADKMCAMHIMRLGDDSYRISATITEYGQTNTKNKKSYPSIKADPLNLSVNTTIKCRIAVLDLLRQLGEATSLQKSTLVYLNDQLSKQKEAPNKCAIVASTFIPGAGQFYKHEWGGGSAFLVSELALIGGGTTCYFLEKHYDTILFDQESVEAQNASPEEKLHASRMQPVCLYSMYACYGVAAALHIGNMIHAWYTPNRNPNLVAVNIVPAIIPINDFSSPSYAMGAGIQIKF